MPDQNLTLDPADWNRFRELGHRMIDDMVDQFTRLRNQPAWQPMPDGVRESLSVPLPMQGEGEEKAYWDFMQNVLPYPNGSWHPRFWGWVQGTGVPFAMLADMLASGLNAHLAGFNQAPALVEEQVIAWLAELMGMPAGTSGLLCSGGTMASVLGLAVARHAKAGFDVRELGVHAKDQPRLMVYGSTETHGWAKKAMELLGLGRRNLRLISVDSEYRIDIRQLKETIAKDRQSGHRPICVLGTAGTVNTGAIDDLNALADLCKRENIWFHIDGAFGALARLSPKHRHLLIGLERADSLAFDLHKWMYLPFEVACLLVRDADIHHAAFASSANYLADFERGVSVGRTTFADRGIELTRGFKALKVWMCLKAYGVNAFASLIEQNIEQAQYLAKAIEAHAELELLAPVPLNVVNFRFVPKDNPSADLDSLNREILLRIQESGLAVPSSTIIDGAFAIRVAIVNHRSRLEDFDMLIEAVLRIGREILPSDLWPVTL